MLLAVDTNVLARALVSDGSTQALRCRQCFSDNDVFVSDTVLLETEWLLRSRMGVAREQINDLFAALIASERTHLSEPERIADVIEAHRNGMDFADAMHLLCAANCRAFATYDNDLKKHASAIPGAIAVIEP
jgi:predicted nucleic-acid-binding protein